MTDLKHYPRSLLDSNSQRVLKQLELLFGGTPNDVGTRFRAGLIGGRLAALRWALGNRWDVAVRPDRLLDTCECRDLSLIYTRAEEAKAGLHAVLRRPTYYLSAHEFGFRCGLAQALEWAADPQKRWSEDVLPLLFGGLIE